jgi:hypothetical protein
MTVRDENPAGAAGFRKRQLGCSGRNLSITEENLVCNSRLSLALRLR